MTTQEFARATGWPLKEFTSLTIIEVREILALYDLKFSPEMDIVADALIETYNEGWNDALRTVESGIGAVYR